MQEHYKFNILGEYRVAGRQAYKIQAMPLDKLRYGYQFGVDQQSGLMLQSTLFNQSGQPLESLNISILSLNNHQLMQLTFVSGINLIRLRLRPVLRMSSNSLS